MADNSETLRGLLSQTERIGKEVEAALNSQIRRSSFEDLCSRYCILAREAGNVLKISFPQRNIRQEDFGLSVGIVRLAAVQELAGLVTDLASAIKRTLDANSIAANALPCPKAAGRPCQMTQEINPNRFDIFFAIPFQNPPTCKIVCDALIDWLVDKRGLDEKRIFRADRWTYSGDFVCKICKAIQESRIVVADVTCGNPNVFFELGLAVGLGKPTILIHDENADGNKIPSDLLAWEYVPYDGENPLEKDWLEHFCVVLDGAGRHRSMCA